MKKMTQFWLPVLAVTAILIAGGFKSGSDYARTKVTQAFQEEAKAKGYAWHSREDGHWVWKTQEEVQDITIMPLVNAAEMDARGQP